MVSLAQNKEQVIRKLDDIANKAKRQAQVLEYLMKKRREFVARDDIKKDLDIDNSVFNALEKKKLIEMTTEQELQAREGRSQSYKFVEPVNTISLTDDQQRVLDYVVSSIDKKAFEPMVLHGVTGSGKTEIYLRAIQHVVKQGNQAYYAYP